ncbi:MAG: hypothetical protein IPL86_18020 [Flavobacteriales bacterium]|nr:hypothetical protein [Flavobacteriales bacterium]
MKNHDTAHHPYQRPTE